MIYEDRIVFFFDILGFRNLVNGIKKPTKDNSEEIKAKLEFISHFYKDEIDDDLFKSKKITFFSDSVIISFKESETDQFFGLLSHLQILLVNLAIRGVLMRGAITYGKLYHDDSFLFGPAFIEAYDKETKMAIYPRIICDLDMLLLNHGAKTARDFKADLPYFFEIFNIDNDKLLYIDYFEKTINSFDDEQQIFDYFINLKRLIEQNLLMFRKERKRKELRKYLWMRDKFNQAVKELKKRFDSKMLARDGLLASYLKVTRIK